MSIRRALIPGVLAVAAAFAAVPAAAQESPFSLEARTGVTIPLGDLSDAGAESDLLFAADVYYTLGPTMSLYGGWAYHRFDCAACADDVTASGPRGGLKILFPTPGDATPWIRGGLTYNSAKGLADAESDRALGIEAGAGIDYALSPRLSITPAARYETFNADFGAAEPSLSYLTLDIGIHLHF